MIVGHHVDPHQSLPAKVMKCANVIISFTFLSQQNRFFSKVYRCFFSNHKLFANMGGKR